MTWQQYYEKHKGRPVRPLYTRALDLVDKINEPRSAIDLGCGAGIETADLLSRGWQVLAIDKEIHAIEATKRWVQQEFMPRLELCCKPFEQISVFPQCNLFYAYQSIPFCNQTHIEQLWHAISSCILPGGIFVGSLFGMKDDWVRSNHVIGINKEQITKYLDNFKIPYLEEIEELGPTAAGIPKNWHIVNIIAVKNRFCPT